MSQAGRLFYCVTKGGSTEQLLGFSASGDKFVRCWLSPNSPSSCFYKSPSNSLCWCLFCRKISVRSFVGEAKAWRVSKNCWRLTPPLEFSVPEAPGEILAFSLRSYANNYRAKESSWWPTEIIQLIKVSNLGKSVYGTSVQKAPRV